MTPGLLSSAGGQPECEVDHITYSPAWCVLLHFTERNKLAEFLIVTFVLLQVIKFKESR